MKNDLSGMSYLEQHIVQQNQRLIEFSNQIDHFCKNVPAAISQAEAAINAKFNGLPGAVEREVSEASQASVDSITRQALAVAQAVSEKNASQLQKQINIALGIFAGFGLIMFWLGYLFSGAVGWSIFASVLGFAVVGGVVLGWFLTEKIQKSGVLSDVFKSEELVSKNSHQWEPEKIQRGLIALRIDGDVKLRGICIRVLCNRGQISEIAKEYNVPEEDARNAVMKMLEWGKNHG